jgi:hypothetical protein
MIVSKVGRDQDVFDLGTIAPREVIGRYEIPVRSRPYDDLSHEFFVAGRLRESVLFYTNEKRDGIFDLP